MIEEDIKEEEDNTEDEEDDIPKIQRQIHIIRTDKQLILTTECVTEDMEYLIKKAEDLFKRL